MDLAAAHRCIELDSPSKGAQFFEGRMPVPCAPFDTTCSLRVGGRYYRQNQFNCKNACVVKPRFNREFQIPDRNVPWFVSPGTWRVSSFE